MPRTLNDPVIFGWIASAFRERKCHSYVHWEPDAQKEFERDCDEVGFVDLLEIVAAQFAQGEHPEIETQKRDSGFEGEDRYVWRVYVEGHMVYLKARVELDQVNEPMLTFVRCHVNQ